MRTTLVSVAFTTQLLLLLLPTLSFSAVISSKKDDHHHVEGDGHDHTALGGGLPGAWVQDPSHPVHQLFRRAPGDGITYPAIGSADWTAGYPPPQVVPAPQTIPLAWSQALDAAIAANKIPNVPVAGPGGTYPPGVNPSGPEVCSSAAWCQNAESHWVAPDGIFASSFDDGPYPQTTRLVQFLRTQNQTTTLFMIGSNILVNPTHFQNAFEGGHDIAVHTWTHSHMASLSNIAIVGELGWTMQIIHNSTGGRVPRFWRPPFGESDSRVRAIAREVFGLETVIWNSDTSDFTLNSPAQVSQSLTNILVTRPKSPGLITLEHDISDPEVDGFIAAYPTIAQNGWTFRSLAQVLGVNATLTGSGPGSYQNAASSTGDVKPKGILRVEALPSSTGTTMSSAPNATAATASTNAKTSSAGLSQHPTWIAISSLASVGLCIFGGAL